MRLLSLVFILVITPNISFSDVGGTIEKISGATHLELSGQKFWKYKMERVGDKIILNVPGLSIPTKVSIGSYSDDHIKKINIVPGPDGGDQVEFELKTPNIDHFDYLTDQPSRLIVDFYKMESEPKNKAASKGKAKKKVAKAKTEASKGRSPAGEKILAEDIKASKKTDSDMSKLSGVFDAADPEYYRFRMFDVDIKEKAIIASKNNIYLPYPMYERKEDTLETVIANPPVYEIKPEDSDENKKARLILTLFNKKRFAVLAKTVQFFRKDYPNSKYNEMIEFMEADIKYMDYLNSKDAVQLDMVLTEYQSLINKYPQSPLVERTSLLIPFSYLNRGDYLNSIKTFTRFERDYSNSKYIKSVQFALAVAYREMKDYKESLKVLKKIEDEKSDKSSASTAAFEIADLYYAKGDYKKAIEQYKDSFNKYSDSLEKFPNAYFNFAESLFWDGKYKAALDAHREFLKQFPKKDFGGYSIARIGELLEILGADRKKVDSAFLETIFRYQDNDGATVAKARLLRERMKGMKDKEVENSVEELKKLVEKSKLPRSEDFTTIMVSDGYRSRAEYDKALELLIDFYQSHPTAELDIFKKRIIQTIVSKMEEQLDSPKYLDVLKTYGQYSGVWLKGTDRLDIQYFLGMTYEKSGVPDEAAKYYRKVLNRLYAIKGTQEEKERLVFESLPSADELNLRIAAMNVKDNNYAEAQSYLDAIHRDSSSLEPKEIVEKNELQAEVALARGDDALAKKYLSHLIENWKGQPQLVAEPYLKLAKLQHKSQEIDLAMNSIEKILALQKDTKNVSGEVEKNALELKAEILEKSKKHQRAIGLYKQILDKFQDDKGSEAIKFKIGKLYLEDGDLKEAEKSWSLLKPDSIWSKMAKENVDHLKWKDQYKKYINRIPAMVGEK